MVFVLYKEDLASGTLEVLVRIRVERTLRVGSRTQDLYHPIQWGQSRHRPQANIMLSPNKSIYRYLIGRNVEKL